MRAGVSEGGGHAATAHAVARSGRAVRLFEEPDSFDDWERGALTQAAGAFERVVELDRDRPTLLVLRLSRSDQPSVRSLRRPLEDVLVFAD